MSEHRPKKPKPRTRHANDNRRGFNLLGAELRFPQALPIQTVEVEVFAQLLDSMAFPANDNEDNIQ